jgi:quercetin dioxygenase-like cupin family protein
VTLKQRGGLTGGCCGNSRVFGGRDSKRNSYQLKEEEPMRLAISTFSLVLVAVMAVAATGFQYANAAEQEYKPKAKATSLLEKPLAGVKGKKVIIKHFEFPPGYVGGKHSHTGPVFVYVLEGELTIETKEAGRQRIKAGNLYQEPIGSVMQARNLSTTDALKVVVFQVGDEAKPMMLKSK